MVKAIELTMIALVGFMFVVLLATSRYEPAFLALISLLLFLIWRTLDRKL